MDMDREGLLNSRGLWNKRGVVLGGSIALAAIVGFNYFFFEQMLGALGLFAVAWLALLAAVFVLVLIERAAELGFARLVEALAPVPTAIGLSQIPTRVSAQGRRLAEILAPLPTAVRRLDIPVRLSAIGHRLAQAFAPLPRAARQLLVPGRLAALGKQLAAPFRQWKWHRLGWAEVRNIGAIDEWRRRQARIADSRSPRRRRAA